MMMYNGIVLNTKIKAYVRMPRLEVLFRNDMKQARWHTLNSRHFVQVAVEGSAYIMNTRNGEVT